MRQVVVTGGGTGIGKAIAHAFATAGDAVVITGRRPEPLAATADDLGSSVRAVRFDAADPAQVQQALGELPGTVDVLVNNAGGNTSIGAPEPVSLADVAAAWQANLDSNLLSAVLVTTALRDRLVSGRRGRQLQLRRRAPRPGRLVRGGQGRHRGVDESHARGRTRR
jgi:3-oxoacyl-[acyl-carrier protein] reductase